MREEQVNWDENERNKKMRMRMREEQVNWDENERNK